MQTSVTTSRMLLVIFVTLIFWMCSSSNVINMNSLQPSVEHRPKPQIPPMSNKSVEEAPSTIRSSNKEDYMKVIFDNTRRSKLTWESKEGKCSSFRVKFAKKGTLPKTMLASFPGSGNTWTRFLIESVTGIFTGSVYFDGGLYKKGFYGERDSPNCGCNIVVKTHGGFGSHQQRVLAIIRNPYEALIAYRNFQNAGHVNLASNTSRVFSGEKWNGFVKRQIVAWKRSFLSWLSNGRLLGVVYYELLKRNLTLELTQMVENLNLKLDTERLLCTLKNSEGKFHRKTTSDAYYKKKDPYSEEQHKSIDAAIHEVNMELQRKNLRPLPLELYNYMKK